jgi:phosphatidyl-myo-inositol dimannoside synthase
VRVVKASPSVLAIVTDAFGGRGGIAQYNRDFLGALVETGSVSSVTVVPRQAPNNVVFPQGIEQMPARFGRLSYSAAAIRTALFRHVDVVFCGHLLMAPLAALIRRLKRAKLIVQAHGIEAWKRPTCAQRAALESADMVLCVSRHTRASVLSWADITPERVLVMPNTVRDVFVPGEGSPTRAAFGLQGKHVLLTVGRMDSRERYKGHDRVIAVIPDLVAKGYDVHYLVVGDGDDRERLETLARVLGVTERVHFLGAVGLQSVVDAYRMADLFVMPSTGEGFGVVFLEAMACGTPTLGFAVAGARDALADGELGTIVSETQFVPVLVAMLGDPKPDPTALAAVTCSRFGRESFTANVRTVLTRLMEVG